MKKYLVLLLALQLFGCATKPTYIVPGLLKPEEKTDWEYLSKEVIPPTSSPCFQGAYYRKVMTSKDTWLGIKGEVALPTIVFDEDRKNPNKAKQYLDNPSVYMGGTVDGQETDIGLTWEVIKNDNGTISEERLAFRPFMRWTAHKSGQTLGYENAPAQKEYYWYPGEKVTMSVEIIASGQLKFIIEGAGKKFEKIMAVAGVTVGGVGEFKRVNAIDQVSNEGKPIQPTKTVVKDAKWSYTTLIRQEDGKRIEVPMHNGRFTNMRCPDVKYFNVVQTIFESEKGAETISINGAGY